MMTWKHHSPVKKKSKTVQSPGKVMATALWDVYEFLLVDFTPPGSAAANQETLKRAHFFSMKDLTIDISL